MDKREKTLRSEMRVCEKPRCTDEIVAKFDPRRHGPGETQGRRLIILYSNSFCRCAPALVGEGGCRGRDASHVYPSDIESVDISSVAQFRRTARGVLQMTEVNSTEQVLPGIDSLYFFLLLALLLSPWWTLSPS